MIPNISNWTNPPWTGASTFPDLDRPTSSSIYRQSIDSDLWAWKRLFYQKLEGGWKKRFRAGRTADELLLQVAANRKNVTKKLERLSRAKLSNFPIFSHVGFPCGLLASRRHLSCSQRYICLTAARRQIRPEILMPRSETLNVPNRVHLRLRPGIICTRFLANYTVVISAAPLGIGS